jgi:3-oxoacyl-[acyl-carrier-protein] synthase-3
MEEISIKAFGAYVPPLVVSNDDLSKLIDTNDQWITERTGIKQRRITEGEDTSAIAAKAAKLALERSGKNAMDIDLIIVATVTPDMFTPSVACLVQKELGADNATAFDINAACSGFVYGVQVASSIISSNPDFKNALVIGAETLSKIVDWEDRSTCVLFGDGAGAVVLSKRETSTNKVMSFYSKSVGNKGEHLACGAVDVKNPFVTDVCEKNKKISQNGRQVFAFATSAIVDGVKQVLNRSGMSIEDIDYIVPHQANARIIEYTAKKLNVDFEKFYLNVDRFGNTSSASIPIALNEMYEKGMLTEGKKIIMVGFGGGLTYGAVLIEL